MPNEAEPVQEAWPSPAPYTDDRMTEGAVALVRLSLTRNPSLDKATAES